MFFSCFFWKLFMSLSIYPLMILMISLTIYARTASFTLIIWPPPNLLFVSAFWKMFLEVGRGCLDVNGLALRPADTRSCFGTAQLTGAADRSWRRLQRVFACGCQDSSGPVWLGKKQSCPWRPQHASQKCYYPLFSLPVSAVLCFGGWEPVLQDLKLVV